MANSTIMIPADAFALFDRLKREPEITAMGRFACHGGVSVYDHSVAVTRAACRIANAFRVRPEKYMAIVKAGMLHDFYGYDYHGCRTKMGGWHAWRHPAVALENARRAYGVDARQANAIRAHMFPGTLFHMPRCAEAWAVNLADKICSIMEYLHLRYWLDARLAPA